MTVGIRLKLTGVTAEQFDKLNAAIDPDEKSPRRPCLSCFGSG